MERIIDYLDKGVPVLFSSNDVGLPAIQDVEDAKHLGFGHFEAEVGEGSISFSGGGAMHHYEKDGERVISWTTVRGDTDIFIEEYDYDIEDVKRKVKKL